MCRKVAPEGLLVMEVASSLGGSWSCYFDSVDG